MAERCVTSGSGFVLAAPASGTGKTVVSAGLLEALRRRGVRVKSAKTGPDYIDPQFLAAAAQGDCINLDPWAMTDQQLRARAGEHLGEADMLVVEGVMGLFDGAVGGGASTADLARVLGLPVVLIVDASRQAQSVAAIVHGFATLRTDIVVAGVIATRVASDRHEAMVAEALSPLDICYLGAVFRDDDLAIPSRHLGLVQATEVGQLAGLIEAAGHAVGDRVDLEAIEELARPVVAGGAVQRMQPPGQKIAVARDAALSFVYPHMLSDWQRSGASLQFFSPLDNDAPSADCDAVFLPGGYPELHAGKLSQAQEFMDGLAAAAKRGACIYGECGGYMVLGEAIIDGDGRAHRMSGLLSHVTSFSDRARHLGYRHLVARDGCGLTGEFLGHEFHYSILAEAGTDQPLFRAYDSSGNDLGDVGGRKGTVMGSYNHIIERKP